MDLPDAYSKKRFSMHIFHSRHKIGILTGQNRPLLPQVMVMFAS